MAMTHMNPKPKVIAFDIFGTVVDWHGSIAAEVQRLKLPVDSNAFATAWRKGYQPAMARVRSGELPWTKIDNLHRLILDGILEDFFDWNHNN
jgi:2-haloacid dehalogenase